MIIIWNQNREGTLFSIITNMNDRLTCYAREVYISLRNSIYVALFYQSSAYEIIFNLIFKHIMIYLMSLVSITLYVNVTQHSFVEHYILSKSTL